jgi:dinuclear metal center YbgI/SA1388 family protein
MVEPTFAEVLDVLREIAPPELAAEWDNTGLLLQPRARPGRVGRVLLTIDLTDPVVAECKRVRTDLVVAYHPPIFQPLRRLVHEDGKQRALLLAAQAGLPVYSPHTALDAAPGGIADWLVDCVLGGGAAKDVSPCGEGFGRVVQFERAVPFRTVLQRLKRRLGVKHLQVARPAGAPAGVRTIAVAAGAGGSVLRGSGADVYLTGEMSHHDALAAVAAGTSVVLAGHSNTERGYLRVLKKRLAAAFAGALDVRIAAADRDPFTVA